MNTPRVPSCQFIFLLQFNLKVKIMLFMMLPVFEISREHRSFYLSSCAHKMYVTTGKTKAPATDFVCGGQTRSYRVCRVGHDIPCILA
jgi:hypothetical protein